MRERKQSLFLFWLFIKIFSPENHDELFIDLIFNRPLAALGWSVKICKKCIDGETGIFKSSSTVGYKLHGREGVGGGGGKSFHLFSCLFTGQVFCQTSLKQNIMWNRKEILLVRFLWPKFFKFDWLVTAHVTQGLILITPLLWYQFLIG